MLTHIQKAQSKQNWVHSTCLMILQFFGNSRIATKHNLINHAKDLSIICITVLAWLYLDKFENVSHTKHACK